MRDQVGIERVVSCDQDPEAALTLATRPADLLPHRGSGARESRHHHGVEAADVDAQLERVGRRHRQQIPPLEPLLDLAAVLGQISAPVGRHLVGEVGVDRRQRRTRLQRDRLGASPAAYEGQRADAVGHQVGDQVSRLGGGGAPNGGSVLALQGRQRRLPERDRCTAVRRPVLDDGGHGRADQP